MNLFCTICDPDGEARALGNLGDVYQRQGRSKQAAYHHQQALALFQEIGDRGGEAMALNGVGETHHATGRLRDAHSHHTAALTLAAQTGDHDQQARAHNGLTHAHNGLTHAHHAIGELDQARHYWGHALTLYTDLGVQTPTTSAPTSLLSIKQTDGDNGG